MLNKEEICNQIEIENLYKHIINLEGLRHPIDDYEMLNIAAEYILAEFEAYGLEISEHNFKIDDVNFRNVEAYIGQDSSKEILLTAHYDTANLSPGANDNASGVAGMLEIARVLAKNDFNKNIRFVGFTLEELHPKKELEVRTKLTESKLIDERFQFVDHHTFALLNEVDDLREKYILAGKTLAESWEQAINEITAKATTKQLKYLKQLKKLFSKIDRTNWIGESICVGSTAWVNAQKKDLSNIIGVINLEEIGYMTNKKHTQEYPDGLNPNDYPSFKTNINDKIGDFIGIFGDKNSAALAGSFCQNCELAIIDLAYHNLQVNMSFQEIANKVIDLLRSDHSPFWRENIPAISITDTFEFRYPFYHTESDVIDNLNFDFMKTTCMATTATIIDYTQ